MEYAKLCIPMRLSNARYSARADACELNRVSVWWQQPRHKSADTGVSPVRGVSVEALLIDQRSHAETALAVEELAGYSRALSGGSAAECRRFDSGREVTRPDEEADKRFPLQANDVRSSGYKPLLTLRS